VGQCRDGGYLDYNDMSVGGHPSDSIPGPLALAYPRGSDGRAVITAIVANYEVARQVGSHVQQTFQRGWDHGILRALWLGRDEVASAGERLRSPMVLASIDDWLAGRRLPLDAIRSLHVDP